MKKTKYILTLFLIACFAILPFARADEANGLEWYYDYANGDSYAALSHVHPSTNAYGSAAGSVFLADFTGYLDFITVDLGAVNATLGWTNVTVVCKIYAVDDQSYSGKPTGSALETSDSQMLLGGTFGIGYMTVHQFDFSHTTHLINGTYYAFTIEVNTINYPDDANHYGEILRDTGTAGGLEYHDSQWYNGATRVCGYVSAIPDADMATATPSPTPYTYQGNIWDALSPFSAMILPLILIIIVALLCGRYAGVWGFFAGLNVTAILVYAIMGAAYMPLWGLVMLALVDGLLLFGKISGRM